MKQIEHERIFLLKSLPFDLKMKTSYLMQVGEFCDPDRMEALRIRQKGDKYELIKKNLVNPEGDKEKGLSRTENRIELTKKEFETIWDAAKYKHSKRRYFYAIGGNLCEIDFYQGRLLGYVRAEVEFESEEEMNNFKAPEWFGEEITPFNHEIHAHLSEIGIEEMKKRYAEKGIRLKEFFL